MHVHHGVHARPCTPDCHSAQATAHRPKRTFTSTVENWLGLRSWMSRRELTPLGCSEGSGSGRQDSGAHSWVTSLVGHVTRGSRHSWVTPLVGHVTRGSRHSWVTSLVSPTPVLCRMVEHELWRVRVPWLGRRRAVGLMSDVTADRGRIGSAAEVGSGKIRLESRCAVARAAAGARHAHLSLHVEREFEQNLSHATVRPSLRPITMSSACPGGPERMFVLHAMCAIERSVACRGGVAPLSSGGRAWSSGPTGGGVRRAAAAARTG